MLDPKDATLYRMVAARANYLSPDRIDAQYAIKECCRGMAQPTALHLGKLKRLARYLIGRPQNGMEIPLAAARRSEGLLRLRLGRVQEDS